MTRYYKTIFFFLIIVSLGGCSLEKDPISTFTELTFGSNSPGSGGIKYRTREEMYTQYLNIYKEITNAQEAWYSDYLVISEVQSDNAYAGATSAELTSIEQHTQNSINKNIERDWNSFLGYIATANRVIVNIDAVPDPALTTAERKQWKAEALIFRAWILFDMTRIWGEIPMVTYELPDITSENITEIYPLLKPGRSSVHAVYTQIASDLTTALALGAPANNPGDKFRLSSAVANGLLARLYAEKPMRDYNKVITYCQAVEDEGFDLVPNYGDLFEVNSEFTDVKYRFTVESVFEIPYYVGSGSWVTWMFGLDLCDPTSTYNWAKWVTPSRDLIKAFDTAGDRVRKAQAIVWGQPSWSIYYPSDNYPFMYKTRSRYNSLIRMRLADILLLKAEAYTALGDPGSAARLVNRVRTRVGLPSVTATEEASAALMANVVLAERRLELAFEGQRWFDLVRCDKAIEVINTLNGRDSGHLRITPINETKLIFPVPQPQLDSNTNLTQNPGY